MAKIAVLSCGNIQDRKGFFNAVHQRIKHLKNEEFNVDVFLYSKYENCFIRTLRHTNAQDKCEYIVIDGIKYNIRWCSFSLIDYILMVKLHYKEPFFRSFLKAERKRFQHYDLIAAHSYLCGLLAMWIKKNFSIPYSVTWHGSEIHTLPRVNKIAREEIKTIIEQADINFFVSKDLMNQSSWLTLNGRKCVLYNGVSENFTSYDVEVRTLLRKKFGVTSSKVIGFVGNLFSVKNANILPKLFHQIQLNYKEKITFWIIGDGNLRKMIEQDIENDKDINVVFWGNLDPESMPDFMNCLDLLVLPSKNEGLPLVILEALACGINVLASRVGGIPEVLDCSFTFDLADDFLNKIATKAVNLLQHSEEQKLAPCFNWETTALIEKSIYQDILNTNK